MSGRVAIVGDAASVAGFRPLGFAAFAVDDPAEARELMPELAGGEYAAVFVTEDVWNAIADLAAELVDRTVPALTVIPGSGGDSGIGREKIERAMVRALGTTVPFGNEE